MPFDHAVDLRHRVAEWHCHDKERYHTANDVAVRETAPIQEPAALEHAIDLRHRVADGELPRQREISYRVVVSWMWI